MTALKMGAWHGDVALNLALPPTWRPAIFWPRTPPPVSDEQIRMALQCPVGQAPISELARGKLRPLIVVDDTTRPTPVARLLPFVFEQFAQAGIEPRRVSILVATGTHAGPRRESLREKLGSFAMDNCRVLVHDHRARARFVGKTSWGSPLFVNPAAADADFLLGIGGIYPQHSTGFGGGSKLVLGILGRRSIVHLHYSHRGVSGRYDVQNSFRAELDEMARMVGLSSMISVHVDAQRQIARLVSGDHFRYYGEAVDFSRDAYRAPLASGAQVVICNAYPMDTSLTFTHSKGATPAFQAAAGTSRILISACSEGIGHHGLFPFVNGSRFERQVQLLRRLSVLKARNISWTFSDLVLDKARRLAARAGSSQRGPSKGFELATPLWLYVPGSNPPALPAEIPGMRPTYSWPAVIDAVTREQGGRETLDVAVYPCAPLHVLAA